MENNTFKTTMLGFIISFLIIIIGYILAEYYCLNQSQIRHRYIFSNDNLESASKDILITFAVSKQWDDSQSKIEKPIGAQYDFVLVNKSQNSFMDWVVKFDFSNDLIIDSSWNGKYSASGNQITFIAEGLTADVSPETSATFGAVMYADKILSLESYILEGYKECQLRDLPILYILIVLSIIWIVSFIIYIITYYKTRAYLKRMELDSRIILQSISTLTSFIDAKDVYTRNHSTRVALYSVEIGRRLKMSKDELNNLYYISLMHDCGKIGVPDQVLNSKERLSDEEYKIIQSHTELGDKMLVDFTAIPNIRDGAHYHHERFDGKGYPKGLKGTDIPIYARIICVADSFDAMASDRCYRKALTKEKVLEEMVNNAGTQFDPEVNRIMISMIEDEFIEKIKEKYPSNF